MIRVAACGVCGSDIKAQPFMPPGMVVGHEFGGELVAVAKELGATPRQVALAFLTRLPDTFAIPKASKVAHVQENAGAASVTLDERQIARLERAHPLRVRRELPTS